MEYILTKENFDEIVLKSEEPILVDFWASWCGPCMMLAPYVEQLSKTHKVGKVNVDEQMELAKKFRVMSIPTLMIFKDGQMVKKTLGAMSKDELLEFLEL